MRSLVYIEFVDCRDSTSCDHQYCNWLFIMCRNVSMRVIELDMDELLD